MYHFFLVPKHMKQSASYIRDFIVIIYFHFVLQINMFNIFGVMQLFLHSVNEKKYAKINDKRKDTQPFWKHLQNQRCYAIYTKCHWFCKRLQMV